eukprot:scaffold83951_cov96-Phaeocystis_antarctica.AAC.1
MCTVLCCHYRKRCSVRRPSRTATVAVVSLFSTGGFIIVSDYVRIGYTGRCVVARWILGERSDHRFEFLEPYGSCRVVLSQEVPGSAEVARGVPKLRGTVSGCLSHTKVFHRGREHAKLLTIANGRRRSKAATEPADVSETT